MLLLCLTSCSFGHLLLESPSCWTNCVGVVVGVDNVGGSVVTVISSTLKTGATTHTDICYFVQEGQRDDGLNVLMERATKKAHVQGKNDFTFAPRLRNVCKELNSTLVNMEVHVLYLSVVQMSWTE